MLFSSITFLYVFLPTVLILYFLAPGKARKFVLLLASLIFYAWGEPKYLWLMLIEIMLAYVAGLLIEKVENKALGTLVFWASLIVIIALLGYFKYAVFLQKTFSQVTGVAVQLLQIALPIGISFYTFQIISYLVDVRRGEVKAQKNPLTLAVYISMFPQLIAGPIVRYSQIEKQLDFSKNNRKNNFDQIAAGMSRFALGLGKKVLIANALGELCSKFYVSDYSSGSISVAYCWLNAVAFTLQIYFDFSGYSDMAIGLGKMFGFEFPENFNYPYISGSITEFWRRWHISLGRWFRDYVYIPLGGSHVTKVKWYRNIAIVWFLTGLWHGASWNFVLWGVFFAVVLILEKQFLEKWLQKTKILKHIYLLLLVVISFVIFQNQDLAWTGIMLKGMAGLGNLPVFSAEFFYYLRSYGVILVIALVGATPLPKVLFVKVKEHTSGEHQRSLNQTEYIGIRNCETKNYKTENARIENCRTAKVIWAIVELFFILSLLILVTAYLVDGSFNPFLYFRF